MVLVAFDKPSAPLKIAGITATQAGQIPSDLYARFLPAITLSQRSSSNDSEKRSGIRYQNIGTVTRDVDCESAIASILLFDLPVEPIRVDRLGIKLS